MRRVLLVVVMAVVGSAMPAANAYAQPGAGDVEVCLTIDESRDTLSPQERASARLLLARQFELAGWRIVDDGCTNAYVLSHVALGSHIVVVLAAPGGDREGVAAGLSDLPALYNQMVRSIATGRPMSGFNVIDRTNVTAAQAQANRVYSDRYGYIRLGYGAIVGERAYGAPSVGFGYRAELDAFGIDVSFLNLQARGPTSGNPGTAMRHTLLKLQALYFLQPTANASTYVGGGVSWGGTGIDTGRAPEWAADTNSWGGYGGGLQGELTVGYELPRASTIRIFVEGNATLPFYRVAGERHSTRDPGSQPAVSGRYVPSVVVSVGFGWERDRDRRRW